MSGNLPTNFQDLTAFLSLVGSDSVERKLGSHSSHDWERMSSVWSSFGMIGALRFYLKLAAGLAKSEKGGVDLGDAALYTATRTKSSLCYWGVNRANSPPIWRNSKDELLSLMHTSSNQESSWLQPIFIAIGYSRCPWNWRSERGIKEIIIPSLWAMLSLAITTIPTIMLFPSLRDLSENEIATFYLQASVSLFAGIILPIIIDRFNTPGVEHLTQLYHDRLMPAGPVPLLRDGDLVMADPAKKDAHIVWQTPNTEELPRSADIWWIRALSASSCLFIFGSFLGNYFALANATRDRQCLWLISQFAILAFRYLVWAEKPMLAPQRPPCLLYLATGSLVNPLSAIPPAKRVPATHPEKLSLTVINFAVAAAISRAHNIGSAPTRYRSEFYAKMAGTVPADLISVEFVDLAKYFNEKNKFSKMSVLRLSWAVVEEIYRAQGVILGPNPWAFGGLFLGAVFVGDKFIGLTTIHPFQLHTQYCTDKLCVARHDDYKEGGFTRDGYFLSNIICGTVVEFACDSGDSVREWHDMFRSNVARCRSSARANGPSYTEIHASTSAVKTPLERVDVSRVEPTINYEYLQNCAYYAMAKEHHDCRQHLCEIYTFGGIDIRMPKSPKEA